ncbi:MAG: serine protease [Alphaproteobacteria bacterium]|nr:serine protease [Alphaproteobacteria bacterium]
MTEKPDWDIPTQLQPDPHDCAFDLDRALLSVVGLRANIPDDAFTASTLGTERAGSGVVIREDGLVLTIGYLVTEAETIWLSSVDGRATPGHLLAYDQETGFGLVQALGRLGLPALPLGDTGTLRLEDAVILAAGGGRHHAVRALVAARQEFAGYWEYLLDSAIFTAPAHPFWGGTALISQDGSLLGIGSLHVQQASGRGTTRDVNMVVPIDLLPPILDDLLTYGRPNRAPRPWLGLYAADSNDQIIVAGIAASGPAQAAGIRPGDAILAVGGEPVADLASLWRQVWASGSAGTDIAVKLFRDGKLLTLRVKSADRSSLLKAPRLH